MEEGAKPISLTAIHPNRVEYNIAFEVKIKLENYENIDTSEFKGYDLCITVALLVNPDLELSGQSTVQANKEIVIFGDLRIRSLSNNTKEQEFKLYFILKRKDKDEYMPIGGKNTTTYSEGNHLDTTVLLHFFHTHAKQGTQWKDPNGVVSIDKENNVFQVDAVIVERRGNRGKTEVLENNNKTQGTAKHLTGMFTREEEEESFEMEDILKATDKPRRQRPKQRDDGRYAISKEASDLEKLIGGPEIKPSDVRETGRFLGQGATGAVHEIILKEKKCAMKQIMGDKKASQSAVEDFKREMRMMSLTTVTELCEKSLGDYLQDPKYLNTSIVNRLMIGYDILLGLAYLHSREVSHCDLKPDNILRDSTGVWKVADFGFSRLFPNSSENNFVTSLDHPKGAPLYMGPERLMHITSKDFKAPFKPSSDVYSFAILLWEILTATRPYNCRKVMELKDAVIRDKKRPPRDKLFEACGGTLVDSVWDLLCDMWNDDPDKRPTFETVIQKYKDILIDNAIWDSKGRKFWKENFCKHVFEYSVPLDDFVKAFCADKQVDLSKDKSLSRAALCLKQTLCKNPLAENPHIDISQFGVVCDALGPWRLTRSYGHTVTFTGIISRIEKLCTKDYFMPHISVAEAHKILQNEPDGVFLLRFSFRQHCLVLSMKNRGKGEEYYIRRDGTDFYINEGETYKKVEELVAKLKEKSTLTRACSLVTPLLADEAKEEIKFAYKQRLQEAPPVDKTKRLLKERLAELDAKREEAALMTQNPDPAIMTQGIFELTKVMSEYSTILKEVKDREQTKKDCTIM